jgi:outer membrane protein assembly factor BamA
MVFCCRKATAQNAIPDAKTRFFGVPLLFYSPDTKLGFGAAGIVTFPGQPFRSSVTFGLAYTLRKQFLVYLPYQLYSKDEQWRVFGELGWYRYIYRYFGVGNSVPNDFVESYTAQYPRLRVSAVRRVGGQHFLGLRCFFDDYNIRKTEVGGELEAGTLIGARGGRSSSAGAVWLYDTRDNQFFPGKGWLLEAAITAEGPWTGSNFQFARFTLDAVRYLSFGNKSKLAMNLYAVVSGPGAPFFNLPQIGGTRRLRGYPDGKYRDRHLLMTQAEWRFPMFWRFKGVVFGGVGSVFGTAGEPILLRPNAGLGLRFEFDRKQQLHLRIDYGFGQGDGNSGAYITIGEAF